MCPKFLKNGELQDRQIIKALNDAIKWYENGEIIEVRDMLLDIIRSIDEFDSTFCVPG